MVKTLPTNRTRGDAIASSRLLGDDYPQTVVGRWVDMPSGKQAFKVGAGYTVATVPNRFAYRDSVIPQARLLAFEDSLFSDGRIDRPDPDACSEGQQCQDILRQCSKHSAAYQRQFGRAANE